MQLVAVVLATAYGVLVTAFILSDAFADLACLDRVRPACEPQPSPLGLAVEIGLQVLVLGASLAALVIARRHCRGRAGRASAATTLVASLALTVGVEALLWYG